MKQILSTILRQVGEDKCTNAGEKDRDELLRSIKKFLVDKRYIIVIDDVWSTEAWEIIKCALIDKNVGSRVIVTTRNMDVAKFSSMDGDVYELDPLSDMDSRRLLCKRVFNEDDGIYSESEEVTKKILKCGGIPLAIITIASMLASIPNRSKYAWYGVYSSMGSGLEKDKTLDNMRNILHLSYSDMPSYLKPCLLYLTLFPEDFTIQRGNLVRLWVAEGLVDEQKGSSFYDIGERSLIVFGNAVQLMPPLSRFSVLRVLCLKDVSSKIIHPKDLGSLHQLRYLELGGEVEPGLLEGIGKLKLLKTLDLWGESIKALPTSIVQLQGLEHLLMDGNVGLKLPDGIGNLTSLQELSVLDVKKSPNTLAELGKLAELRTLSIKGLNGMESYMKTFLQSLSNLGNLRTLEFFEFFGSVGPTSLDSMSDQWRGPVHQQSFDGNRLTLSVLPRWFSSLSELSCLSIWVNVLRQVDLQLLGALPVLRFLKLQVEPNGMTEEQLAIGSDQPFRSLAEFEFRHCSRCWLVFGQGAMPKLQRLKLYFEARKREGGGIDVGLENLTSLKHVTVKIDCDGARVREVEDVETRIRDEVDNNQNHPTLKLSRFLESYMKYEENNDICEASEQQS
ncbi:hypothetical protein C2845_PM17G07030 [Panicum miliaceum]|uniref:Uncharacterized protein n=1 Tax=Panicum miliaceum TaxID=4540 RepID=A0A3L6PZV2_PANMI|nr:hypothetical protein C2845_PM17G07030 [Panicum miliaceum]